MSKKFIKEVKFNNPPNNTWGISHPGWNKVTSEVTWMYQDGTTLTEVLAGYDNYTTMMKIVYQQSQEQAGNLNNSKTEGENNE